MCKQCINEGSAAVNVIQDILILKWFLYSGLRLVEMGGRLMSISVLPIFLLIFLICLEHQICKSDNETFYETNIPPSNMYSFRIVWKKGFLAITVHHGALCRSMLWKYNQVCFHVALDSCASDHCDFMFAALFFTASISHQIASSFSFCYTFIHGNLFTNCNFRSGPCCVRPDVSFV